MFETYFQPDWITEAQVNRIIQILQVLTGPIAPVLLQDLLKSSTALPQLLDEIERQIPKALRGKFRQQTAGLITKAIDDPAFICECETALMLYVGVIASLLTATLIQQQPDLSQHDFVDALAVYLKKPDQIDAFRRLQMSEKKL